MPATLPAVPIWAMRGDGVPTTKSTSSAVRSPPPLALTARSSDVSFVALEATEDEFASQGGADGGAGEGGG